MTNNIIVFAILAMLIFGSGIAAAQSWYDDSDYYYDDSDYGSDSSSSSCCCGPTFIVLGIAGAAWYNGRKK
jgi:hypothetical protein